MTYNAHGATGTVLGSSASGGANIDSTNGNSFGLHVNGDANASVGMVALLIGALALGSLVMACRRYALPAAQ